jgi:hypothetical protein
VGQHVVQHDRALEIYSTLGLTEMVSPGPASMQPCMEAGLIGGRSSSDYSQDVDSNGATTHCRSAAHIANSIATA